MSDIFKIPSAVSASVVVGCLHIRLLFSVHFYVLLLLLVFVFVEFIVDEVLFEVVVRCASEWNKSISLVLSIAATAAFSLSTSTCMR